MGSEVSSMGKRKKRSPVTCHLEYGRTTTEPNLEERYPAPQTSVALFSFSKEGFGFGQIAVEYNHKLKRSYIDSECMGRERVREFFNHLIDSSIFDTDTDRSSKIMTTKHNKMRNAIYENDRSDARTVFVVVDELDDGSTKILGVFARPKSAVDFVKKNASIPNGSSVKIEKRVIE